MWYLLALLGLAADRITKRKAQNEQFSGEILRGRVQFTHLENHGLIGGKLHRHPKAVKLIPGIAYAISLPIFLWGIGQVETPAKCGISLLLAGGSSNVYDRLRRGSVTDFLRFPRLPGKGKHFIFNVADIMLFFGAILTIPALIKRK